MSGAELNEARQVAQYEYVIHIVAMTQSLLQLIIRCCS